MARVTILAAALGFGLAAVASSQQGAVQRTNLGEELVHVFSGHKLTGKAAAQEVLLEARAAAAGEAFQEPLPVSASGELQLTNTGVLARPVFEGHHLTPAGADGSPVRVLYAPSEADDPAYRAAIATAIGGGATVDYFDARASTPSVATLLQYDAAYTWANFAYSNNTLFGDNLAAYNDQGGTVVLGVFCTYTSGNFLAGAIMGSAYCPVDSPLGNNHFTSSTYTSGGTTCIYNGVTSLTSTFRDFLVTQGSGIADGFYPDGEICHAYRGTTAPAQGDVVYSNGAGAVQLGGSGEWGTAVGNACVCSLTGPKVLYAPSEVDDPAYRAAIAAALGGATVDYFDAVAATPSPATLANYDGVHTWANFAYADNVAFGNNLAAFVDGGGDVVLGAFCTYTTGNFLAGAIMTPAYCPVVSPLGTNHFSQDTDTGPYFSCLTAGATALAAFYRDFLQVQGDGIMDSKFDGDKEIATAFRRTPGPGSTAGDVVYANGSGGSPIGVPADGWPLVIANGITCDVGSQGPAGSCAVRLGVLGVNPTATSCLNNPVVGEIWNVTVATTGGTLSTFVTFGFGGPVSGLLVLGNELLILPPFVPTVGLGAHNIPVPPVADFIGQALTCQGARVETGPVVTLTNALDIVPGIF